MPPENWEKLNKIFHEAFLLKDETREEFLRRECPDEEMYGDLKSLLESSENVGEFLNESVMNVGAKAFAGERTNRYLGLRLGSHKIVSEISRGGMGTVYLASRTDDEYQQRVAVKIVRVDMETPALIEKFRQERQFLANLNHPNIARLLDGGTTEDGLPYLVMEYVKGLPVTEFCVRRNLNITERLRLFQKVCKAVSYAHAQGIVHRDLKPSNILVDEKGEPKLLDFGIAKVWDDSNDHSKTATELRIFTPDYASPEQIRGGSANPASDIYSLGVLLYEILTAQKPFSFENRSPLEIAQIVCESEPEKPSTAIFRSKQTVEKTRYNFDESKVYETSRLLRGDLDNIILMAMRKEPARRYESAEEFCGDIEKYLKNQPVKARPNNLIYRTKKFVVRNRAIVSAAAMILIAAVALTAFSIYGAKPSLRRDSARRLTDRDGSDTLPHWTDGGQKITFSREMSGGRMKIYEMNADGQNQHAFEKEINTDRLIISPDNTKFVYRSDENSYLYVYDSATDKTTQITKYRAGRPAWSPDSKMLTFTYNFSQNLESNETPFYRPHDNTEIFSVNADGTGERNLTNNSEFDSDSAWSPDGKKILFTSNRDGNFEIYSMNADGTNQMRLTNNLWDEHLPVWSPDGSKIAFAGNRDGHDSIYLMNPDGTDQTRLTNSVGGDVEPAWSPDGKQIVFASECDGNWEIYLINVNQ